MRNAHRPARTSTWAELIKSIRAATGLPPTELARRLGVNPTTIWRWETGRQKPESPDVPQRLATLFHLDLDVVLTAAGLKPDAPSQPQREPEPPMDPDVKIILRRLADPDVTVEEKTTIRAMLNYLASLADRAAERPVKKAQRRRPETG